MDKSQKIKMLRAMLGADDDDVEVLEVYLDLAKDKILNRMYPYKESFEGMEVPDKYAAIQLKVANYMLNKRGAEGQIQHIENGIHRYYGDSDVPESMLKDILPFCQVIQ